MACVGLLREAPRLSVSKFARDSSLGVQVCVCAWERVRECGSLSVYACVCVGGWVGLCVCVCVACVGGAGGGHISIKSRSRCFRIYDHMDDDHMDYDHMYIYMCLYYDYMCIYIYLYYDHMYIYKDF